MRRSARPLLVGLAALAAATAVAALGIGAVEIPPTRVLSILGAQAGVTLPWPYRPEEAAVLLGVRLPRVAAGALVGAALAVSGAAMQGLFRNPLADPALVGVTAGASLGAALVIVLGEAVLGRPGRLLGPFSLPAAAFLGGLVATFVVYRLGRVAGRATTGMLLVGIGATALAEATIGLLALVATDEQLRDVTFWRLGSLGRATWATLGPAAAGMVVAVAAVPWRAPALNALLLGEPEAEHLGIDVPGLTRVLVLLVALGVGAAVSISGGIGFVGLVVPHVVRLVAGPDHRTLLPASALLGASLLLAADVVARTTLAPAELPIGVVTAFIGVPFFIWLVLRDRRRYALP